MTGATRTRSLESARGRNGARQTEEMIMGKLGYSSKLFKQSMGMAKERKALWLPPLMVLLGIAAAVIVGSGAATPLIYAFF